MRVDEVRMERYKVSNSSLPFLLEDFNSLKHLVNS